MSDETFMYYIRTMDEDIIKIIYSRINSWKGIFLNRIAWSMEGEGKEFRGRRKAPGFMPVDTGRAKNSVYIIEANTNKGQIIIGSNLEYMEYIEEGTPTVEAFAPFRRGSDYAMKHEIMPEIDKIIDEALNTNISKFLRKMKIT